MPELPALNQITPQQLLLAAAAFVVVLSLWLAVMLLLAMRREAKAKALARRLGEFDAPDDQVRVLRLWNEGEEVTAIVPTSSSLHRQWVRLKQLPVDAGWEIPIGSVLLALFGAMLLAGAGTFVFTGQWIPAAGVAVAIVVFFSIYAKYRIAKNEARFERQFSDALQLMARSLRAGHPLAGAFRLVSEETGPPVGHIFARICQEQSMGISQEQSLRDAADEHASEDLKLFATSVSIQLRTGGNLADMMDRLAEVMRSRIRLSQRVRVVSAQTQLSKRILLALPLVMLLGLSIVNPSHMEELWSTSLGNKLLIAGGIAMLLGWYTMNRMARIRY